MISGKVDIAVLPIMVVALHAMPVEDRLDIAREIEHIGEISVWFDPAGRPLQRQQQIIASWMRSPGSLLVTADTGGRFARLDGHETLHPFYGHIVFVQGNDSNRK